MNNEELMVIEGYNILIKHRENKKGGGVGLYIDSELKFEPAFELNQFGTAAFESLFANVELSPGNTIMVGVIYRPPGGSIGQFNDGFDTMWSTIKSSRNKIFLTGDFNINLLNGFQSTRTLTKSYHANSYPSQLVPTTTCYIVLCSCSYYTLHNNMMCGRYEMVWVRVGSRYELVRVRVGIRYELAWIRVGMVRLR